LLLLKKLGSPLTEVFLFFCPFNWHVDNPFVGPSEMMFGHDKKQEVKLRHNVCNVIWTNQVCVSLATRTCIVWRNMIFCFCQSIESHFKRSVNMLIEVQWGPSHSVAKTLYYHLVIQTFYPPLKIIKDVGNIEMVGIIPFICVFAFSWLFNTLSMSKHKSKGNILPFSEYFACFYNYLHMKINHCKTSSSCSHSKKRLAFFISGTYFSRTTG